MGKRLIGSVGLADSGVPDDLLTTKGDTHGFSSTNARIPIGDNDQVLTADSSEALGLKWASAGGSNLSVAEVVITSSFSTTSTSFVDVTGLTQSKPTVASGNCFTIASVTGFNTVTGNKNKYALDDNGTGVAFVSLQTEPDTTGVLLALSPMIDTSSADGNTVKMVMAVEDDTGYAYSSANVAVPKICSMAI